jgi:hypothetical protein
MGEALITSRNAKPIVRKTLPVGDTNVGDIVLLNVSGVPTEFIVVHQGKPSGTYSIGCDGTWLLMKDIYTTSTWVPGADNWGWEWRGTNNAGILLYLQETFFPLLDTDIQNSISTAVLPFQTTFDDEEGGIFEDWSSFKVFLLSCTEVGLPENYDGLKLGGKLDYFEEGATDNAKLLRVAYYNNSAEGWFLRSAGEYSDVACGVYDNGTKYDNFYYATGVRPALILPFDTVISRA